MYLNITQISKDKTIQDAFTEIIQSIISKYAPQKIVLFGSYARGEAHEGSDIDLMLIKETSKRFVDRIGDVLELNNTLMTLEPLVYSPLEFETMKKQKRDFILTIEEEGIEIYDDRSTKMA
jgi:predicted nucleotidyltransferase